ncbi:hypothetical protein ACIG56_09250 [Nocardia fusca]|uniref:hypothetical protein n=1 Tax=Nocardia fusca TaxID=941183 RepID=UPI0037C8D304
MAVDRTRVAFGRRARAGIEPAHRRTSAPNGWADAVRTGSEDFAERAHRLESRAGEMDPVELFDLAGDYEHYRALGRSTAPFGCGDYQDIEGCRKQLDQLRAIPGDS